MAGESRAGTQKPGPCRPLLQTFGPLEMSPVGACGDFSLSAARDPFTIQRAPAASHWRG